MEKISVIIPCYNVEKYVDRCLNSISNQTIGIDNLEIILVDDGSKDNTLEHLEKFENNHPDNTILVKCENNGASAARNIGMSYATCDYIAFIDADDILSKSYFSRLMEPMIEYNCDMVECKYMPFSDDTSITDNEVESVHVHMLDLSVKDIRKEYITKYAKKSAVWSRIYKSDFLKKSGLKFVEGLKYEDVHFTGVGMFLLNSVCEIEEPLYYYYENQSGIIHSSDYESAKQEIFAIQIILKELNERNILGIVLEQFKDELEFYCIIKGYIDPIIFSINTENLTDAVLYFGNILLNLFPEAGKNKYAVQMEESYQNKIWGTFIPLLRNSKKEPMVTVKIIGGLGNQMRCFCIGYMLAQKLNLPLTFDVSDYYYGYFRQYLLDYLNIPSVEKMWHFLNVPIYADKLGLPYTTKDKYEKCIFIDEVKNTEELFKCVEGVSSIYLYGYDINNIFENYGFNNYKQLLKPKYINSFYSYFHSETSNKNSVSVHVRRTDFVDLNWSNDGTMSFYIAAMNYIREQVDTPIFYIFSDDAKWAREQFIKYQDCCIIDSFGGEVQSLYDLFCMAECKYHILTNKSTYSKWASLLSTYSEGFSICECSEDKEFDKNEYKNLNMIFFDKERIKKYNNINNKIDNAKSLIQCSKRFNEIEENIIARKTDKAMSIINEIATNYMYDISEEERLSLIDYKALIHFQNNEYEMALDSFRILRGIRRDYDFMYNFAYTLELTGHHMEAICYATISKLMNPESDIDNIVITKTTEELRTQNIIKTAFEELCIKKNIRLIFVSNLLSSNVRRQFISMQELLSNLGFDCAIWKVLVDPIEELSKYLSKKSIMISNELEKGFKIDKIPLITFIPNGYSNDNYYYSNSYNSEQIREIKSVSDYFIDSLPVRNTRDKDFFVNTPLLTWDTYVNDDEIIIQSAEILKSIINILAQ